MYSNESDASFITWEIARNVNNFACLKNIQNENRRKSMKSSLIGAYGEHLAAKYLREEHYDIKTANFKTYTGEIDLIAEDSGGIVFVEVKTRSGQEFGAPSEAVTIHLCRNIIIPRFFSLVKINSKKISGQGTKSLPCVKGGGPLKRWRDCNKLPQLQYL